MHYTTPMDVSIKCIVIRLPWASVAVFRSRSIWLLVKHREVLGLIFLLSTGIYSSYKAISINDCFNKQIEQNKKKKQTTDFTLFGRLTDKIQRVRERGRRG